MLLTVFWINRVVKTCVLGRRQEVMLTVFVKLYGSTCLLTHESDQNLQNTTLKSPFSRGIALLDSVILYYDF